METLHHISSPAGLACRLLVHGSEWSDSAAEVPGAGRQEPLGPRLPRPRMGQGQPHDAACPGTAGSRGLTMVQGSAESPCRRGSGGRKGLRGQEGPRGRGKPGQWGGREGPGAAGQEPCREPPGRAGLEGAALGRSMGGAGAPETGDPKDPGKTRMPGRWRPLLVGFLWCTVYAERDSRVCWPGRLTTEGMTHGKGIHSNGV